MSQRAVSNILQTSLPPEQVKAVVDEYKAFHATAVSAWAELDRLARELSAKTGQPYYTAYMNVIDSPRGKKLYAAGLSKPSVAGTAA